MGGSPFVLTAQRKALMIKEMQSGVTGGDDEEAILEVLDRSFNFELSVIFGAGGVAVDDLNSDFQGDNWLRLQDFYERRFEGGLVALKRGDVTPKDTPVPLGESLPFPGSVLTDELPGAVTRWNPACVLGLLCTRDRDIVTDLPSLTVKVVDRVEHDAWYYDGSAWIVRTMTRGGFSRAADRLVGFLSTQPCETVVETVVHEVRHIHQPATWTVLEKETDAYRFAEEWTIERGFPGRPAFRTADFPSGRERVDVGAIEEHVRERYAGPTAVPGEEVMDHTPAGDTVVMRPDGSTYTRAPVRGDSHQKDTRFIGERIVPPETWVCP